MTRQGCNFIGATPSANGASTFRAFSTAEGRALEDVFHEATIAEVERAVALADSAATAYRQLPAERRAGFLDKIADEILALGDDLIALAHRESALPVARLTGERMRTVNQLRMFAALVREGSWVDARIDTSLPDRQPLPRPDLRRLLIPLGPVAVFGASNFPFAFSTAGGDTASALAAGCPVVVKAHPAHPGTAEMTARAILAAAEATGMPDGVFSMLHGGAEVGVALVREPALQAVAFTGSLKAGRALFDAGAARPRPIPVFAELGSVNPVFVLPGALAERGAQIAAGLAQSVTLGVGQFCTNPGVTVIQNSTNASEFARGVAAAAGQVSPASMLTRGIGQAYMRGVDHLSGTTGVRRENEKMSSEPELAQGAAAIFSTDAATFLQDPTLAEEVFGPSTILVGCRAPSEMEDVARSLDGQLTVTVHANADDLKQFRGLITILETKAGRILFNAFPTGVEVSPAMQHGGPYPASTDSRSTSVGTAAILRFVRPVCYQDAPAVLLPPDLQDANPLGILRLINSAYSREPIA